MSLFHIYIYIFRLHTELVLELLILRSQSAPYTVDEFNFKMHTIFFVCTKFSGPP